MTIETERVLCELFVKGFYLWMAATAVCAFAAEKWRELRANCSNSSSGCGLGNGKEQHDAA
ncbi:MAG: hypothetical protein IJ822_04360 [Pyramidobacter sp.]|nr:hypothetical protein [Pyramidobacter sp.]MBQ8129427.1 hypothetical protein [Clostridia bacterium]MBR1895993.1 hypothetical protein [Pyramidobacter sp.]